MLRSLLLAVACLALVASACSSDDGTDATVAETTAPGAAPDTAPAPPDETTGDTEPPAEDSAETSEAASEAEPTGSSSTFTAEVWADNWFAMYANGDLVGEDSVPITTERSFNAERFSFDAGYPLTIAIEAKDFKETDSGIEYIGLDNQQMGDGGLIAQITDDSTGEVVAVTSGDWTTLVIHRAPLNTDCEKDPDPDATCESEISEAPADWTEAAFDDSGWAAATEWTEADVGPKDGYDEISWDPSAELIWGSDLEVDNTILVRLTVAG